MKLRNIILLVIAAAVLIAVAVNNSKKEKKAEAAGIVAGQLLFPDLALDDVEKIVIRNTDSAATLEKAADVWISSDRFKYPANFQKIRDSLIKLSEIKISQKMNVSNSQREVLRMQLPSSAATNKAACGTLVQLFGKGNKVLASLLIGSTRERKAAPGAPYGGYPDGQFVSTDEGRTAFLLAETVDSFSSTPKDWIDSELVNVALADIREISVTGPGRTPVKLTRRQNTSVYDLEGLTAAEEIDLAKQNTIEGALGNLRFSDIADPAVFTEAIAGLDKPSIYQATTSKGEVYTVKLGSQVNTNAHDCYAKISVELVDVPAATNAPASTNTTAAAEEKKALREKVKTLNDSLAKWTFILDAYKVDAMLVPRAELVKPKAAPEQKKDGDKKIETKVNAGNEVKVEAKAEAGTNTAAKTESSADGKTEQKKGFWKSIWPF